MGYLPASIEHSIGLLTTRMLRHDDAVVLRDDLMMTDQELRPGVTSIDIPVETKRLHLEPRPSTPP